MRVFLFEHLCGGGMLGEVLPAELVEQGAAMLRAVALDFVAAGCDVVMLLEARATMDLPGAQIITVDGDVAQRFDECARSTDAALVIAPEFDGILDAWAVRLESLRANSLGCTPSAVALCADKLALANHLRRAGVPTPVTWLGVEGATIEPPVIVKPRFGVGCEDTFVIGDEFAWRGAPHGDGWIVQPYVPGLAASVSFLVRGQTVRPLPAGRQMIEGSKRLTYSGGQMPLPAPLASRATTIAERAVCSVAGLNGFVGVDVVLGDDERKDVVIEINPRLTMSYVGLSALCTTNLAKAMVDASAPLAWSSDVVRFDAMGRVQHAHAGA